MLTVLRSSKILQLKRIRNWVHFWYFSKTVYISQRHILKLWSKLEKKFSYSYLILHPFLQNLMKKIAIQFILPYITQSNHKQGTKFKKAKTNAVTLLNKKLENKNIFQFGKYSSFYELFISHRSIEADVPQLQTNRFSVKMGIIKA